MKFIGVRHPDGTVLDNAVTERELERTGLAAWDIIDFPQWLEMIQYRVWDAKQSLAQQEHQQAIDDGHNPFEET